MYELKITQIDVSVSNNDQGESRPATIKAEGRFRNLYFHTILSKDPVRLAASLLGEEVLKTEFNIRSWHHGVSRGDVSLILKNRPFKLLGREEWHARAEVESVTLLPKELTIKAEVTNMFTHRVCTFTYAAAGEDDYSRLRDVLKDKVIELREIERSTDVHIFSNGKYYRTQVKY